MGVSDDEFGIVIISLTMFCLVVMYATLSISAIKSFRKIIHSNNSITLGKSFYGFILAVCFVRIFAWIALAIELWFSQELVSKDLSYGDFLNKLLLSIRYIPETLFIITFMMLLWNVLVLYHVCHMKVDRQLRDVSLPPLNTFGKTVLSVLITLIFCEQAIVTFVFWVLPDWDPETYIYANAFLDIFPPSFLICVEIYLRVKFSGVPYKSKEARERAFRVNLILIFWAICQGITGGLKFYEQGKEQQIFQAILGKNKDGTLFEKLLGPVVFVALLFFLEVLPLILITDSKSAENFLIKQEIEDELNHSYPGLYNGLGTSLMEQENKNVSAKNSVVASGVTGLANNENPLNRSGSRILTSSKDVTLLKIQLAEKKEGRMGEIVQCHHQNEMLFARVITCDKITKYVAEQLLKEFTRSTRIDSRFLLKIRGYYNDDTSITILYENAENKSLHGLLHDKKESKQHLSFKMKSKFVTQIAAALQTLHSQNPAILHGHLTSSNVLLDKEFDVKLTDYGLPSLKKYMSVKTGYSIMDASIPPEYLSETAKYVNMTDTSADIYAFGFLLWEIFAEEKPFGNINTRELYNLIVKQQSRPKIPATFNKDLANLIRACWQSDPKKRPTIDRVIDNINQMDGRNSE